MKQASAYFHDHSDKVLKSFGCIPTEEDDCCYTLNYKGNLAIINKHVDDFGLMSKSKELITYIKSKLSEVYEITVDPEMKFYLGLHLVRDRENKKIKLDQTAMMRTKHIDVRYNMIRELCAKMIIIMTYFASKDMTSDTLTKALAPAPFIHLRKR